MSTKEPDSELTSPKVAALAENLRRKLEGLGGDATKHKSLDRLPVDMTDVYVICANYQRLVDSFLALPTGSDPSSSLRIIFEIESHLYHHLPHHYKPLLKSLKALILLIEPDKKKREAISRKYFDEVMKLAQGNNSSKEE